MKFGKCSFVFTTALMLILCLTSPTVIQAQGISLTILVPDWMQDIYNDDLFAEFERQHLGVAVTLARNPGLPGIPSVAYDLESHLDAIEQYTQAADVVLVSSDQWNVSREATRAGYFLDLAPLIAADATLNPDDFYTPVWQSYQWDGGVWVLPASASPVLLVYDTAAFDRAGLVYPNESWSLDDLGAAASALAVSGATAVPGLATLDRLPVLFHSLTGRTLFGETDPSLSPKFSLPELEVFVSTWAELEGRGAVTQYPGQTFDRVPMRIEPAFRLQNPSMEPDKTYNAALLPGGAAGLDVRGFAVSAGTQYRDLAYELAKYLTFRPEVTSIYPFDTHARKSLSNGFASYPAQFQPLMQNVLEQAVPLSSLLYGDYVAVGVQQMMRTGEDAVSALRAAEESALAALQAADERRSTNAVSIATPIPPVDSSAGEVVLNFGLNTPIMPLVNQSEWDSLTAEFVASDTRIARIDMQLQTGSPREFEDVDCFYYPQNEVANLDLTTLLSLDPFLDADPDFDPADMIAGALTSVQRDNRTWAYPIVIEPSVLWYNTALFAQAGLPAPEAGWTVDAFDDALKQLQPLIKSGTPAFVPPPYGNTYLLLLIGAYGGLPLDYRTDPPTVRLTDPETLDAARQVLDLAKTGMIDYKALDVMGGGSGFGGPGESPMYGDRLDLLSFRMLLRSDPNYPADLQRLAPYPHNSQFTPVSYSIGTAYISAETPNPDACYRWLSFLARHPALFAGMPARASLIDDPALVAAQGQDAITFYHAFAQLLQTPNVVVFPELANDSLFQPAGTIEHIWLNRAFDNYVLHDADLEVEFTQAELFINTYRTCAASIPPFDPAGNVTQDSYAAQLVDCAVSTDPAIGARFGR